MTRRKQSGETRRQYTQDFKLEAVRLVGVGDKSLPQVARDLGVRADMLRQWKRQAEARAGQGLTAPRDVFPGNGKLPSQDEEIRRLKRENAQLREERDILGKAMAFFARTPR